MVGSCCKAVVGQRFWIFHALGIAGRVGAGAGNNRRGRSGCYSRAGGAGRAGGRRWGDHGSTGIDNHRVRLLSPPNSSKQSALSAPDRRKRQNPYNHQYQDFFHLLFLPNSRNKRWSRGCRQTTLHHKNGCASATDDFLLLFLFPLTSRR